MFEWLVMIITIAAMYGYMNVAMRILIGVIPSAPSWLIAIIILLPLLGLRAAYTHLECGSLWKCESKTPHVDGGIPSEEVQDALTR